MDYEKKFRQAEKLKKIKDKYKEDKKKFEGKGLGVYFENEVTWNRKLDAVWGILGGDQKRIEKKYNSKRFPNFRLTVEYLKQKYISGFYRLSKKKICRDLKISMGTLNLYLLELNRFEKFQPMRWISIEGRKNWIEVAGFDFRNSNKWIKKNFKGFISRTARVLQTKGKVRLAEEEKALKEMKKKQKLNIKN